MTGIFAVDTEHIIVAAITAAPLLVTQLVTWLLHRRRLVSIQRVMNGRLDEALRRCRALERELSTVRGLVSAARDDPSGGERS